MITINIPKQDYDTLVTQAEAFQEIRRNQKASMLVYPSGYYDRYIVFLTQEETIEKQNEQIKILHEIIAKMNKKKWYQFWK